MHAGLTSAVPLSFAGSTSLGLKSSGDSQHRLTCIDIGQTSDVLCGRKQVVISVNGNDYNLTGISHAESDSVGASVDWKLLHLLKNARTNEKIEGRTGKNVSH